MADYVKKARAIVKDVMKEFAPAKDHAVGSGREFLLALRSVIDAEINLLDRATKKTPAPEPLSDDCCPGGAKDAE